MNVFCTFSVGFVSSGVINVPVSFTYVFLFFQMSRNYYSGVSVTFEDKTAQINDIIANNSGDKVNILFAKSKYKAAVSSSFKECCNYKFVVLYKDCRNQVSTNLSMKLCGFFAI